ncbi:uncharacterized protein K02A2.6-like [Lineus longissimus]|uniref:uncharacterized protein K02A2.6-like n=1 Tax=Lineus longissimus TaxID=88925 RepID=UPI00315CC439
MAVALANLNQGPTIDWDCGPELYSRYRKWRQKCQMIFDGPLQDTAEAVKCKYLLIWAGDRGLDLFNSWGLTADEQKLLENYWKKFEEFVNPHANYLVHRFKLRRTIQNDRPFEEFLTELRLLVADCGYTGDTKAEMLRDSIVFGVREEKVRSKCIEKGNTLTLNLAIEYARVAEATKLKSKEMDPTKEVHAFRKGGHKSHSHGKFFQKDTKNHDSRKSEGFRKPAGRGQMCYFCGSIETQSDKKPVDSVHAASEIIRKFAVTTKPFHKQYASIQCKLDTGAATNVIPKSEYRRLFPPNHNLTPPTAKLVAYGGTEIANHGSCTLYLRHNGKKEPIIFDVTDSGGTIIGLKACQTLDLIRVTCEIKPKHHKPLTKEYVVTDYKDVFTGIGSFPGEPYHIELKDSATPTIHPPRAVGIHLQDGFKSELERMESLDVLAKVEEPTEWVNSFVIVDKGHGKGLRICLDPRDLNEAIKREHYYTRTIDDIAPKLAGATHFSVVDARSGYWMVRLDEQSSLLTTFSTPFGRYRYKRLPFGLIVSQDIFQRKMDEPFGDLAGVTGIADDIFVFGAGEKGHDNNFIELLECARENNVKFNLDKLQFKIPETKFFGHQWTATGMKPDPAKVRAITEMSPPTCIQDLQSYLGLVNYLNRFNASIATIAAPLRDLTKKEISWQWNPEHQAAFDKLKGIIISADALAYFDPKKPSVLQTDASLRGLGAVLMQDEKPVCYASRTLSETEQNYSNIERELLGVVWSLERFNHYVYGKHVIVQTDHKPIVAAAKKPISKCSPRLQRLLLRMSKYDVAVEYLPGKKNVIADPLSRVDPNRELNSPDFKEIPDIPVNLITRNHNATDTDNLEKIRHHTKSDNNLQILKALVVEGWPETRDGCPAEAIDYFNYREDVSVEDGLLFKCDRIIIPNSLRKDILKAVHQGHQGIEKCILRAKQSVFWPGLTNEIKQLVSQCSICQAHQNKQQREPLKPHSIAQYPWQRLASDLFEHNQVHYLLYVDYYSKFPVVRRLGKSLSSETVIAFTKSVICEYGIPEELVSDNGPQYDSYAFKSFCASYGIKHTTSSPHYAQSNGMVEKCVQTVKKLILKALDAGEDANIALLNYRTTPVSSNIASPAKLLMSREPRTTLPMKRSLHQCRPTDNDSTKEALQHRQDLQKHYYDQRARAEPFPELQTGQNIRVQDPKSGVWNPGYVTEKLSEPRSYTVKTDKGTYRRNRKYLRATNERFTDEQLSEPENFDIETNEYPGDITPPTQPKNTAESTDTGSGDKVYQTRSGRSIRKPSRYDN